MSSQPRRGAHASPPCKWPRDPLANSPPVSLLGLGPGRGLHLVEAGAQAGADEVKIIALEVPGTPPRPPRCKCCGGGVSAFAELDATRSCEDRRGTVFPPSGRMIAYWRCGACGFVFTADFDALSPAELGALIYNDDYTRADPDFAIKRPTFFAGILASLLAPAAAWIDVLDFGGGGGTLADMMRARGFARFASYDPYFGDSALPPRRYDLVTAFEVVEHSRDPVDTFREITALRKSDGAVLFSTLLQPKAAGPDWWYIAPRNGHVSIHTSRSSPRCGAASRASLPAAERGHASALHRSSGPRAAPDRRAIRLPGAPPCEPAGRRNAALDRHRAGPAWSGPGGARPPPRCPAAHRRP